MPARAGRRDRARRPLAEGAVDARSSAVRPGASQRTRAVVDVVVAAAARRATRRTVCVVACDMAGSVTCARAGQGPSRGRPQSAAAEACESTTGAERRETAARQSITCRSHASKAPQCSRRT